jgi:hypothetical protein
MNKVKCIEKANGYPQIYPQGHPQVKNPNLLIPDAESWILRA